MTDIRDELLERIVGELRTLPPADEAAVGRIVEAVAAEDEAVRGARFAVVRGGSWWHSRIPLAAAAGIALAAGLAGFVARDLVPSRPAAPVAASSPTPGGELTSLASAPGTPRPPASAIPTQFVLDAPTASRVTLVGDFNGWDATATPLVRESSSGIWTATVPLPPGRHVYAFMVDGRAWTLDPRAPTAQDPDFGTPSSVVLVGAP